MTEAEIKILETQLKSVPLPPLSDGFFDAVRADMDADDTGVPAELSASELALETQLRALTPTAPSEAFFARTAEALREDAKSAANTVAFPRIARWISAAAAAGAVAAGLVFWRGNADNAPHYELVSTENVLNNIEELPVELTDNGELVRPVRYIYTNKRQWRDPKSKKSYVEYRPFVRVVPTSVSVY